MHNNNNKNTGNAFTMEQKMIQVDQLLCPLERWCKVDTLFGSVVCIGKTQTIIPKVKAIASSLTARCSITAAALSEGQQAFIQLLIKSFCFF